MATIGFQLAYGNPHIVHLPQHTTSSSFTAGDVVVLGAGYIQLPFGTTHGSRFFGVAQKSAVATAGTSIPVHVISPEDVFIVQMETDSAVGHVGMDYGVTTTAGSQVIATGGTGIVSVIDLFEPAGTTTGKVLVKFVATAIQGNVGTSS